MLLAEGSLDFFLVFFHFFQLTQNFKGSMAAAPPVPIPGAVPAGLLAPETSALSAASEPVQAVKVASQPAPNEMSQSRSYAASNGKWTIGMWEFIQIIFNLINLTGSL